MRSKNTFLLLLCMVVFLLGAACGSTPKPGQEDLDRLNVAMARAESARSAAAAVQAQTYFPDEWNAAQSQYEAGRNTDKETLAGVEEAIRLFTQAAEGWEAIAEQSGPRFAEEMESARAALEEAKARAEQSRQEASDNQGPALFPDDWEVAEATFQESQDASTETIDEMRSATSSYAAAGDAFDYITERCLPLMAEMKDAQAALQAAANRAEQSRKAAQGAQANTRFANEWQSAETMLQAAKDASVSTSDEIKAATAQFVSAADAFDGLAARGKQMTEQDAAKAAQAAQAARAAQEAERAAQAARAAQQADAQKAAQTAQSSQDAQKTAQDAKANAEKERQLAIDERADVAVPDDFNKAEATYQEALTKWNAKDFAPAATGFGQSATQFAAATEATRAIRSKAESAVTRSRERAAESTAHATNIGNILEGGTNENE